MRTSRIIPHHDHHTYLQGCIAYIGSLIGSRAFNCGSTTPKAAESSHFRPKIDFFDDEDVEDYCTDFSDDVRSIGSVSSKTESSLEDLSDDEAMSGVGTADQVIDAELLNQRVTTVCICPSSFLSFDRPC